MNESTLLAGRVIKQSLPVLQPPIGTDAPLLKRLMLPQGELAQFFDAQEPMRYAAYLELRAGSVRGNHYHKIKSESIYVIQGELLMAVQVVASGAADTVSLVTGDIAVIATDVAHAFRVIRGGHAIEFSNVRFDPADVHRFSVI